MVETISPDYLVIGAGASCMAFVDTLVSDTKATVAIVDRYSRPGGHWTIAYPFVTLHQPSSVYGVNSRKLGDGKIDQVGLNKGFAEMATGDEIVSYYNKVMNTTLLPSGRVSYYPLHNYTGDGEFQSITTGKVIRVGPNARIVDTTYMKVKVPAMGPPAYEVSDKVNLITPNALTTINRPYPAYTIVGAGKTAVDACVWMLTQGIDSKKISWIMPRDSWFLERAYLQPPEVNPDWEKSLAENAEATMGASTSEDLFARFEARGLALRIDKNVKPTMFRHAIVSSAELALLRKVENIVRKGRIIRIDPDKVTLEQGTHATVPDTLFIDCTAAGLSNRPIVPIFNGRNITLQCIKFNQPTFSAAFIAHVEATYASDESKNHLCTPVPYCVKPTDYAGTLRLYLKNWLRWVEEPKTAAWCDKSRLDTPIMGNPPTDPKEAEVFNADVKVKIQGLSDKLDEIVENDIASAA